MTITIDEASASKSAYAHSFVYNHIAARQRQAYTQSDTLQWPEERLCAVSVGVIEISVSTNLGTSGRCTLNMSNPLSLPYRVNILLHTPRIRGATLSRILYSLTPRTIRRT